MDANVAQPVKLSRMDDVAGLFRRVSLFSELDDDQMVELARSAIQRTFPRETIIFQQGDSADALYIIRRGKVKVLLSTLEGRDVIVSTIGAGEWFGEMAIIDSRTRCARVETMTSCQVTMIPKNVFDSLLDSSPKTTVALLRGVIHRLRAANRNIGSLAALDVSGRVARVLLDLAVPDGQELVVNGLPTQREIADMVGASREMVNRAFKGLLNDGYISLRGKTVVINERLEGSSGFDFPV